jgi:hypothetical protein
MNNNNNNNNNNNLNNLAYGHNRPTSIPTNNTTPSTFFDRFFASPNNNLKSTASVTIPPVIPRSTSININQTQMATVTGIVARDQVNNEENVMNSERIQKAKDSLAAIYEFARRNNINYSILWINEFVLYVEELLNKRDPKIMATYERKVGNVVLPERNYLLDAIFAMTGKTNGIASYSQRYPPFSDQSHSFNGHCMGNVLGLVYHIIVNAKRYKLDKIANNNNVVDVLRHGLIKTIGSCVEDDGHLICEFGKSQQTALPLQGVIPGVSINCNVTISEEGIAALELTCSEFINNVTKAIGNYIEERDEDHPLRRIIIGEPVTSDEKTVCKLLINYVMDEWIVQGNKTFSNVAVIKEIGDKLTTLRRKYLDLVNDCMLDETVISEDNYGDNILLSAVDILPHKEFDSRKFIGNDKQINVDIYQTCCNLQEKTKIFLNKYTKDINNLKNTIEQNTIKFGELNLQYNERCRKLSNSGLLDLNDYDIDEGVIKTMCAMRDLEDVYRSLDRDGKGNITVEGYLYYCNIIGIEPEFKMHEYCNAGSKKYEESEQDCQINDNMVRRLTSLSEKMNYDDTLMNVIYKPIIKIINKFMITLQEFVELLSKGDKIENIHVVYSKNLCLIKKAQCLINAKVQDLKTDIYQLRKKCKINNEEITLLIKESERISQNNQGVGQNKDLCQRIDDSIRPRIREQEEIILHENRLTIALNILGMCKEIKKSTKEIDDNIYHLNVE